MLSQPKNTHHCSRWPYFYISFSVFSTIISMAKSALCDRARPIYCAPTQFYIWACSLEGECSVRIPSGPPRKAVKFQISQPFCNFFKDLARMRTDRFRLVLGIIGNVDPEWFASKNRIWKVEASACCTASLAKTVKRGWYQNMIPASFQFIKIGGTPHE